MKEDFVSYAIKIYRDGVIPLHRPVFEGNEKKYLLDCIDSNFVSSVGEKVVQFENLISTFVGSSYAVATVNGTSALHVALEVSGVKQGDEVITQALTFIATCNSISYVGAVPVFVDVDKDTMGMSPTALKKFLETNAIKRDGQSFNKFTGNKLTACVPMHTYGFPCRIKEIADVCKEWDIILVEDAAESLGSHTCGKHTGLFGKVATLSFNGNKIITTGGGGMLITNDKDLAKKAKHITTTAKLSHPFDFVHDQIAYNYRMPNLNAALGCAQMERLEEFLIIKKKLAEQWKVFFESRNVNFVKPISKSQANYWLNTIILDSKKERDEFLQFTNDCGVMTRPAWKLMSKLKMFKDCQADELENSLWLEDRIVNIPSSVPQQVLNKF